MKKLGLLSKLIIAIILGIIIGNIAPQGFIKIFVTFNNIFGSFLGFAIPLIIIGFIAPGIGDLGKGAGKLLALTAGLAYLSTILSGTLAYVTSLTVLPRMLNLNNLVVDPNNPNEALLQPFFEINIPPIMGVMTALTIAFILGLGIAATQGDIIKKFMDEFQAIIRKVISNIIIPLLPLHILGIFANMTYAGEVATIISVFAKVFVMIVLLHIAVIIIQYLIASTMTASNPFRLIRTMIPAYFTAIGTQSSAATIPVTLRQAKLNGVDDGIAEFVIPLCATIHLSGSTITLTSCAMAVMMLNGMATPFSSLLPFILMLGVTMVAAPGVPGGAIMAALGLLETMLNFSPTLTSLMITLYLAQDSFGTACNVTGDGAIAIIMNKISGKKLKSKENPIK